MEPHYDVKAWAGETALGRRLFNYNFRMSGGELTGWQLLKAVPMHRDRSLSETTYLWQRRDAPEAQVRANVAELADWRGAQKHLLQMLKHTMRPDLPRGTGRVAEVGDVEFVARAPRSDIPAAVEFTRGNVAVAVNSVGSLTIDVSEIAATVDRLLTEPPTSVPSFRRQAKRLGPKAIPVKRREAAPIVRDLRKLGDAWVKVIVPDGELRRKGDTLVYVSPQPGRKPVQIFSVGAPTR